MNTENNIEPVKAGVKPYMFWIAFVSVLGGLLFGFDTAVNTAMEAIDKINVNGVYYPGVIRFEVN